tara:strand:- start:24256 stop:24840 length:585 start_codon:yes stop_codon:yes gene_type:complete
MCSFVQVITDIKGIKNMKIILLTFLLLLNCNDIDKNKSTNLNDDKKIFKTVLNYLDTNELIVEDIFYVDSQPIEFDSTSVLTFDNDLIDKRRKVVDDLSFNIGNKETYVNCLFSNHMIPVPQRELKTEISEECRKYKSNALIQISVPKVLDINNQSIKVFYYINQGYKVFTFELDRSKNTWIVDNYRVSGWVYS